MGVGSEGVGVENPAARLQIGAVNPLHHLRMLQSEQLRALSQPQARGLEHGAHGAVQ